MTERLAFGLRFANNDFRILTVSTQLSYLGNEMLRKLFTLLCLCGFVASMAACSTGHGTDVKKGDAKSKETHKQAAEKDPDGNIGLAGPED